MDAVARGLGARANSRLTPALYLHELIAAARAAQNSNPITLGVMASPPVIGPSANLAPASFSTPYNPIDNADLFTANTPMTVDAVNKKWFGTYGYQRFSFVTDSPKPVFKTNGNTNTAFAIQVNGQYVSMTPYSGENIGQSVAYTPIDFTSAVTPRQFRRYDIEGESGSPEIYGISIGPTDTLYAPAPGPRVVVVGDSYTGETGANYPGGGWANIMGQRCGWDISRDISSPGGTGYTAVGQSATFINRISNVAVQKPRLIIVAGGINDADAPSFQTAVLTYLQTLRSLNPVIPVVVLGSWIGGNGQITAVKDKENMIKAAFNQWADPLSAFVPISLTSLPLFFGTGRSGAQNGSGNADYYIGGTNGTDTIHMTQAGHNFVGQWAANRVVAALTQISTQF